MGKENAKSPTKVRENCTDLIDDCDLDSPLDGMGTGTAQILIDRKLRKTLLLDYDLLRLNNEGRYYAADAISKDGHWFLRMLIEKQTGEVAVFERRFIAVGK